MPSFTTEHRVKHSAQDMFDLVADVDSYPQFVPLCERMVVRARTVSEGKEVLIADMTIGYKLIRETFTSRVTIDRAGLKISASNVQGPFRHLDNRWSFTPISRQESIIRFSIEYEFRSRTLGMLMGAVFDQAFHRFADAFEARADQIYGTPNGAVALR